MTRRPFGEQAFPGAGPGDTGEEGDKFAHHLVLLGVRLAVDEALEALDTTERQVRCRGRYGTRHLKRRRLIPATGAPAIAPSA